MGTSLHFWRYRLLTFVLTLIAMPLFTLADVEINEKNFPDKEFRNFLKEQDYGKDGVIKTTEINQIKKLLVGARKIQNLEGIKFFVAVEWLDCCGNFLKSLDVSGLKSLKRLECEYNRLKSLDVSGCKALETIDCSRNKFTSLTLTGCPKLSSLTCYVNELEFLDVSDCSKIKYIYCCFNQLSGENMDEFIRSLPNWKDIGETGNLYIYSPDLGWVYSGQTEPDHNICTKKQVKDAKAKGWNVYKRIRSGNTIKDVEYKGVDPAGVSSNLEPGKTNTPWYDLNGRILDRQDKHKGIYIHEGRKILVK